MLWMWKITIISIIYNHLYSTVKSKDVYIYRAHGKFKPDKVRVIVKAEWVFLKHYNLMPKFF